MADTLKTMLRQNGRLQAVTSEEASDRAITPAGGKLMGDSPHQQKMRGTPNQKQAVFNAQDYRGSLQQQQRLEASEMRQDKTDAETRAYDKSESLKNLGGLGDRINNLINAEVSNLVDVGGMKALDQQGLQQAGYNLAEGYDYNQFQQAANQFAQSAQTVDDLEQAVSSGDMSALATLNQALGKSPTAPLTIEELKGLYQSVPDTLAANIAAQMPDQIMVTDDLASSLGYEGGISELADLLGVTEAEVQGMNVLQLDEAAEKVRAEEFNEVKRLQARLADPNVSATERRALSQKLRQLGASGVRATEKDVDRTIERIEAGETIEFAGEEYKLDELLQDEEISGVIKSYLEDPENTPLPPGLKDFVEDNKAALQDAADELDDDVAEFAEIQKENLAIGQTEGGTIDDKVLDSIFGEGWKDQFRGSKLADDEVLAEYPGLKLLQGDTWDEEEKAQIVSKTNQLAGEDTELAKQILSLTPQELQSLGLNQESGKWSKFIDQRRTARKLERLGDDADLDSILDTIFGRDVNTKQIEKNYQKMQWAEGLGIELPGSYKTLKKWLSNPQDMVNQIKKAGSLKDIMKMKKVLVDTPDIENMSKMLKRQIQDNPLYKYGHYAKDGKIDSKNAKDIAKKASWEELTELLKAPALTNQGKKTLKKVMSAKEHKQTKRALNTLFGGAWKNPDNEFLESLHKKGHPGVLDKRKYSKWKAHLTELELKGKLPGNSKKMVLQKIRDMAQRTSASYEDKPSDRAVF